MGLILRMARAARLLIILVLKAILAVVPKDRRLILFSAWNGQKYADSSMFVFEYMLGNPKYHVVWYTKNKALFQTLLAENKPVVYSKSIKGIWHQIRAVMLCSAVQFGDYNPYLLSRCIYYDMGHGFPIKQSGFEQPDCTDYYKRFTLTLRKGIRYYMSASSAFIKDVNCRAFEIRPDQNVFSVFPRLDVFYDPKLREPWNKNIQEYMEGRTVISYLPTHRAMGKVPLHCNEIFDLEAIQRVCEEYNCVFLIKKHFFHQKEREDVSQFDRIIDITDKTVETQTLLYQTDILVTDYSACSIDYSVLDRPILFHAYDLSDFLKNERNLYVGFDQNHAGYKTQTKKEFTAALKAVLDEKTDQLHSQGREALRRIYFDQDCQFGKAREGIQSTIEQMINNSYVNKWEATK